MRGISCEQFVVECYRPLLYTFMNQSVPIKLTRKYTDMQLVELLFPRDNFEHFWRVLLGEIAPDADHRGTFVTLNIENPIVRLTTNGRNLKLHRATGEVLILPLTITVNTLELTQGRHQIDTTIEQERDRLEGMMSNRGSSPRLAQGQQTDTSITRSITPR